MTPHSTNEDAAEMRPVLLKGVALKVATDRPESRKFWSTAAGGTWEDDTLEFVTKNVDARTIFVDVGAWIGPISLVAASLAKRVIALEPDPVAFNDLTRNAKANTQNIDCWHVGIDNAEGTLVLYAPSGLGNSVTSSFASQSADKITVPTVTFKQIAQQIDGASKVAVKVDIEGHEYVIIDQLVSFVASFRAPLHLSLHPRAIYDNLRCKKSALQSKRETFQATADLIRKLGTVGEVLNPLTGRRFSKLDLIRRIYLRRRAKNFSVVVRPFAESA